MIVVAVEMAAGYNVYTAHNHVQLSDLALNNVEALAIVLPIVTGKRLKFYFLYLIQIPVVSGRIILSAPIAILMN